METYTTSLKQGGTPARFLAGLSIALLLGTPLAYATGNALFGSESLQAQQLRLENDYERQTSIIERSLEQKAHAEAQLVLASKNVNSAQETKWSTELDLAKVKLQLELQKEKPDNKLVKRLSDKVLELVDVFDDSFSTTPTEEGDGFTME